MNRNRLIGFSILTIIIVLVGLALANRAEAGTAVVTWTNPTQRVDGTALPVAEIGSTKVEYGTCAGAAFGTLAGSQSATGAATTLTISNLTAGTHCFRAYSVTTTGAISAASNVASKVVPESPPGPPTIATVVTTAYLLKGPPGHRYFAAVGAVPLGTVCGKPFAPYPVYATIPLQSVILTDNYNGQTLYGICA